MTNGGGEARAAMLLGLLAVAAIPAGVAATQLKTGVGLLQILYVAVPVAVVLGLAAVGASRRARFAVARSVRADRAGAVRAARFVAWLGLYAGVTGALALAVYGLLRFAQG